MERWGPGLLKRIGCHDITIPQEFSGQNRCSRWGDAVDEDRRNGNRELKFEIPSLRD